MATAFLFPTTTTVQPPTSHGKQGAADIVDVTDDDRWMTFPRFPFSKNPPLRSIVIFVGWEDLIGCQFWGTKDGVFLE